MAGGILYKMLVLWVNEMAFAFPLSFKRLFIISDLQDRHFLLNY